MIPGNSVIVVLLGLLLCGVKMSGKNVNFMYISPTFFPFFIELWLFSRRNLMLNNWNTNDRCECDETI